MKQIDMSSEAVTRRLRQASEMRDLCLLLMKAKNAHDEKVRAENAVVIDDTQKDSEILGETSE
ncbi:MAG: hypothetical protein ABIU09_06085 [Pyrinomonadaceae bacterium]